MNRMFDAGVRLVLVLAVLAGAGALSAWGSHGTAVPMAGGALLLAGLFAGKVTAGARLPKLTGYLLIGFLIGPALLGLVPRDALVGLSLIKGLAVSLIALAAGTELHLSLVRRIGLEVAGFCAVVCAAVSACVAGAAFALRPLLPFMKSMPTGQALAVACLIGVVLASFSVTVTIAIVTETRARGAFTEFLMAFVIIGDLIVLVAFAVAVAFNRAAEGGGLSVIGLLKDVGWELFGSIGIGALIGLGMRVYLRRVGQDVPIFLGAVCLLSAQLGLQFHLSPLLLALAAGALLANVEPDQVGRVERAAETVSLPVFAVFFAAAGAGLDLDALKVMGPVALALAAVRGGVSFATSRVVIRQEPTRRLLWMGLVSQAGVTFGLAAIVGRTFPSFGTQVETLLVAVISIHELVGPILARRALTIAGETHAGAAAA
jgi:Kef-type K+ transport system membrane component KefB